MDYVIKTIYTIFNSNNFKIIYKTDERIALSNNKSILSFTPFSDNNTKFTQFLSKYLIY